MLTIFGKKKKDEADDKTSDTSSSSTMSPTPTQTPQAFTSPPLASSQNFQKSPSSQPSVSTPAQSQSGMAPPQPAIGRQVAPGAPLPEEETSLTRLLRSLIQDIPASQISGSSSFIPES